MTTRVESGHRWVAVRLMGLSWAVVGTICAAGDDVVVNDAARSSATAPEVHQVFAGNVIVRGGQGGVVLGGVGRQPQYDLGGLFDQHAFGRLAGHNQVFIVNGRQAVRNPSAMERALAAVRERCELRIDAFERICGLDRRQVRLLGMALESDLKRVGSQIEAAREEYAGRALPATPQGLDRDVLGEVRDRALECRALLDALPGPDSLLGGVLSDMLVPEQARRLTAWLEGRRACRWKAMVKAVLVQLDESGLGLSHDQASALEKGLLETTPPLDVLRDGTIENRDSRKAHFQIVLVTSRLGRHKDQWEPLLDPRQRAMLTERIDSYGDPSQVEAMLVYQGVLERTGAPSHDKETN